MIQYLLDTNAVIALLNEKNGKFAQVMHKHKPEEFCLSSIVTHELFYGAFKSQRIKHNLHLIDGLCFDVIEFDKEDSRAAGEIRAILVKKGLTIGGYDVLLAGQAKARGLTLITRNLKEFNRIDGLKVENWYD